jgi:hypothetical protein
MKYQWTKQEKEFYLPPQKPTMVTLPPMNFFMLKGKGNPNHQGFAEAVGVLYSLAYGVKMMPKGGITPEGYFDYAIYPLEGVWDLEEEARGLSHLDKDRLVYTLMIRQPSFVTPALAQEVIEKVNKKKPHPLLERVTFESLEEGTCLQMLHLCPYDNEPASFALMEQYCKTHGLKRLCYTHREIYLSDQRKTAPERLKTVLRFKVAPQ